MLKSSKQFCVLPLLLGIVGGVIAWYLLLEVEDGIGRFCLVLGFVITVFDVGLVLVGVPLLTSLLFPWWSAGFIWLGIRILIAKRLPD